MNSFCFRYQCVCLPYMKVFPVWIQHHQDSSTPQPIVVTRAALRCWGCSWMLTFLQSHLLILIRNVQTISWKETYVPWGLDFTRVHMFQLITCRFQQHQITRTATCVVMTQKKRWNITTILLGNYCSITSVPQSTSSSASKCSQQLRQP